MSDHLITGLERAILERAALGHVLEEPDSAPAVGAAYRRLDHDDLIAAEWYRGDALPLTVTLTPTGRAVLRANRR